LIAFRLVFCRYHFQPILHYFIGRGTEPQLTLAWQARSWLTLPTPGFVFH
jgi:hypothetical protein